MTSLKEACLELRKRDLSLNEIAKHLHRSKTTVFHHIRHIPLSDERHQKYFEECARRIIAINHARKGKSRLGRKYHAFSKWSPRMVSLVAHFLFDGQITAHSCIYHNRSRALIDHLKVCVNEMYAFPPIESTDRTTGVIRISYHNVALTNYIRLKSQELLVCIELLERPLQRSFLQAFFDDEGCIYFRPRKNSRLVRGYQYNPEILFLIQRLLSNFGIVSKVHARHNEITISYREHIERFAKEINFSKGLCINGKRSNSIWKQSLEKRELLRRAIASYQS